MIKYLPKNKNQNLPSKLKFNPIHTPLLKFIHISNSKREYKNVDKIIVIKIFKINKKETTLWQIKNYT